MNLLVGNTRKQARDTWIYLLSDIPAQPGEGAAWMYCEIGAALLGYGFKTIVVMPITPSSSTMENEARKQWLSELELKVRTPTDVVYL